MVFCVEVWVGDSVLRHHGVDASEVSSLSIVVKSVSDDEVVRDFEAAVRYVEIDFQVFGFDEQCCDADVLWIFLLQQFQQFLHGESRVNDVFDDDDGSAFDVLFQSEKLFYLAGGGGSFVGGESDESDFAIEVNAAQQVCGKDERAVEHGEEQRAFAFQVLIDLCCHFRHALHDLCFRKGNGEFSVANLDFFHGGGDDVMGVILLM